MSSLRKSNCDIVAFGPGGYAYTAYNDNPEYTNGRLFRSSDGGVHWDLSGSSGWNRITDIAVTPAGDVLVGTYGTGLFRSTDSGATWSPLTGLSVYTDIQAIACSPGGAIYVGCGTIGGIAIAIFRSTDGGNGWERISPLVDYNFVYAIGVGAGEALLAALQNSGMIRSTNGGATWDTVRADPPTSFMRSPGGDLFCTNSGSTDFGVSRSTDNGLTWQTANAGLPDWTTWRLSADSAGTLYAASATALYTSSNEGDAWAPLATPTGSRSLIGLACDAGSTILAATRYDGVRRSSDKGATWTAGVYPSDASMAITAILAASPADIFVGTYPGYALYASSDSGTSWNGATNGLSAYSVNAIEASRSSGHLFAATSTGFFVSADHGQTWIERGNGLSSNMVQALGVAPDGEIFAGTYFGGVFRTADEGAHWEEVNNGISYKNIVAVKVLPNGNILAGGGAVPLADNSVYCSTDNGDHWHAVLNQPGLAFACPPSGMCFAVVTGQFEDFVLASTDFGETWLNPNAGASIYGGLALVSDSAGVLILATENLGVFVSRDEGKHWDALKQLPGDPMLRSIAVDAGGILYVGTDAGLFRSTRRLSTSVDDAGDVQPASFALQQNYPNPFNPVTRFVFTLPMRAQVTLTVSDVLGRQVSVLLSDEVSAGAHEVIWDASGMASGVYLCQLRSGGQVLTRKLILLR